MALNNLCHKNEICFDCKFPVQAEILVSILIYDDFKKDYAPVNEYWDEGLLDFEMLITDIYSPGHTY